MNLRNKNILLISPEPWSHIFVSKHHYAIHLAELSNQVFFLNPPSGKLSCKETEYKNLYSAEYNGFLKGLRWLPGFLQKIIIRRKFEQLQKLCKTQFDIVWSFDNSVFYDFSALPKQLYCVSHIVDFSQDFQFKQAALTADLCLGVCQSITNKQKQWNLNSHFINHGFNNQLKINSTISLPGSSKTKVFYAGNLDIEYIDWSIVNRLIAEFPSIDFVFAGPWINASQKVSYLKHSNFHYVGVLKSTELSAYYQLSDILLITYRNNDFPEQLTNTHKMMGYLGSGKMIAATWTAEYEQLALDGLIKMAKSANEFNEIFKEVISNLAHWNSAKLRQSRIDVANENTYHKQIEKIENLTQGV